MYKHVDEEEDVNIAVVSTTDLDKLKRNRISTIIGSYKAIRPIINILLKE